MRILFEAGYENGAAVVVDKYGEIVVAEKVETVDGDEVWIPAHRKDNGWWDGMLTQCVAHLDGLLRGTPTDSIQHEED